MPKRPQSMKEIAEAALQKEDYKLPGKLLLWGMAVGQWMAILIVGLVFLRLLI